LQVWEVATAYPLVFTISASDAEEAEKEALYQRVRRCRKTAGRH
jgi:hypothetical protein